MPSPAVSARACSGHARPALLAPPALRSYLTTTSSSSVRRHDHRHTARIHRHLRPARAQMALSLGKLVLLAPCLVGALYTADGGSKLAVQPVRLVRLLNSVYGAEHLLLFGREEECVPHAHTSQSHPPKHSEPTARAHTRRVRRSSLALAAQA